jgi:hypothetical protein
MALRANGAKDGVNRQGAVQGTSINNGATIAMAGNVPSTGDTNDAGLGEVLGAGSNFNFKPSKIDQDTFSETEGASVANRGKRGGVIEARGRGTGTFAYDNQRGVIRTVSTTINGAANTTLESGGVGKGGRANSSIGGLNSLSPLPRYSFKADGSILAKVNSPGGVNAATGWDTTISFIDPAVAGGATAANDGAAAPTRAIPGELAYMESAKTPKQDDYKAKTG